MNTNGVNKSSMWGLEITREDKARFTLWQGEACIKNLNTRTSNFKKILVVAWSLEHGVRYKFSIILTECVI